jgi:hypothetical protein
LAIVIVDDRSAGFDLAAEPKPGTLCRTPFTAFQFADPKSDLDFATLSIQKRTTAFFVLLCTNFQLTTIFVA